MASLVEIVRFSEPEEAYCAQSYLRAQGFETIVQNEYHLTMAPWLRVALGGYPLLGLSETANDARAALRVLPEKTNTSCPEEDLPKKKQSKHTTVTHKNWLWAPIAFFWAVPFVPTFKTKSALFAQLILLAALYAGLSYSIGFVGGIWNYLIWFLS